MLKIAAVLSCFFILALGTPLMIVGIHYARPEWETQWQAVAMFVLWAAALATVFLQIILSHDS